MPQPNGEFFEEIRKMMVNQEVPEKLSRMALWGGVSITYREMLEVKEQLRLLKGLRVGLRVLAGVVGLLVLFHLHDVAAFADAAWRWFITVL